MVSWTMTTMLTVASALGVVAVSHAILAPASVSASPVVTATSTGAATNTHKVVYTTYRGDDGSSSAARSATSGYDN